MKHHEKIMKFINTGKFFKLPAHCHSRLFKPQPFLLALNGRSESGKSTFILELLGKPAIKKIYGNRVYIVSNSKSTLIDYFNRLVQVKTFTNDMPESEIRKRLINIKDNESEKLHALIEHLEKTGRPDRLNLLILDNVNGSMLERRSKFTNSLYTEFRQIYLSVIKANNSYSAFPPIGRKNTTVLLLSKMSKNDLDLCVKTYCPDDMTYKTFEKKVRQSVQSIPVDNKRRWSTALIELSPDFPAEIESRIQKILPSIPKLNNIFSKSKLEKLLSFEPPKIITNNERNLETRKKLKNLQQKSKKQLPQKSTKRKIKKRTNDDSDIISKILRKYNI